MIEEINGIVLQEVDYGETSKILTILSKEHGIISVISKGCRNLKSSLRSVSSKMTYGIFQIYYKENKLSILSDVDVLNNFNNIKKDIYKISAASYLMDLTNQVIKESKKNVFDILISSLIKIEEGFDFKPIISIVELKYLDNLGVLPVLDSCAICGDKSSIVTISGNSGGYLCKNCRTNEIIVSDKTIKLIRMFYYVDISKIDNLNISSSVEAEIDTFLTEYYYKYTGLYLKSKDFLRKIESE